MWVVAGVIIGGTAKGLFGTHTLQDPKTGAANRTPKDFENVEVSLMPYLSCLFIALRLTIISTCKSP
jgi:hypothetical protein